MKKLMNLIIYYAFIGLAVGVYYREFTKINDFDGVTMLKSAHPHLISLGVIMLLLLVLIIKVFSISIDNYFKRALFLYNVGLHLTVIMMLVHGTLQVLGQTGNAMISGFAGLGHILIAIGLIMMLFRIRKSISE